MRRGLRWTASSHRDITRLYDFLAPASRRAAKQAMRALNAAAHRLQDFPFMGQRVDANDDRDMRRVFVQHYELRYEVTDAEIIVVRIWHMLEDR